MADTARGREDFDMLRRLERLEERQLDMLQQMTESAAVLKNMSDDVKAVAAEVGGAPDTTVRGERETLRWRVHNLENSAAAAAYAKDALAAAQSANTTAKARQWSIREKLILLAFAGIGAIGTVLTIIVLLLSLVSPGTGGG